MASGLITDKGMQARAGERDKWIVEPGPRGAGRLVGRITPGGERILYYRYTNSKTVQVRLLIGAYDPHGDGVASFTVQQARDRARDWATLYRSGIRDLREHFAQEQADNRQAQDDARLAAELTRQQVEEQARAAELERERRITVRQLFDRWRMVDLQPHIRADGKRAGRKFCSGCCRSWWTDELTVSATLRSLDRRA